MSAFKLLIDGMLVEGADTLDVINPATGRILTAAPRADRAQLDEAVTAAKTAFPGWSAKPLGERGALLVKLGEALDAEQYQFARLLTEEQGKPLPQALDEVALAVATIRYFGTLDLSLEVLKEDATQKVVRQQAARRSRGDHAVEPAGAHPDDRGRAGPPRRERGRGQASPDHTADDAQVR
jgi:acyl-CoA reductase-like NAD-dependent aldehyde dehydrogenase